MRALCVALALFGCAPRVAWTGRSADRRIRAEVMSADGEEWLRTGGREGPRFGAIATDGVVFSSDGKRLAYPAERDGRWLMIIDGQPEGPWDGVAEPTFSSDGARFAYLAEIEGRWRPVVDRVRGKDYEAIQEGSLRFSGDGKHVAFVALTARCAAIVVDDIAGDCHEGVALLGLSDHGAAAVVREHGRFQFLNGVVLGRAWDALGDWAETADGARAAYAALAAGRWYPVVDGEIGHDADAVRDFHFGDGDKRVAFIAVSGTSARVVVDGVEGPAFALVGHLMLAARGPTVAYHAEDERGAWVVVDGERRGRFAAVLDLALSADGRHLAFVARREGRTFVVHDGREVMLDTVVDGTLVLAPDGEHWAVLVADAARRQFRISFDGESDRPVSADDVLVSRDLRPFISRKLTEAFASAAAGESR
jgi:hypothetical protein